MDSLPNPSFVQLPRNNMAFLLGRDGVIFPSGPGLGLLVWTVFINDVLGCKRLPISVFCNCVGTPQVLVNSSTFVIYITHYISFLCVCCVSVHLVSADNKCQVYIAIM